MRRRGPSFAERQLDLLQRHPVGAAAPVRIDAYRLAGEIKALAQQAQEYATAGPRCDLVRAEQALRRIAELLG